jgi:adenosyl cobinamide kinase/adenosyl cobinamide phosphate guanylyltransferase
MPFTLDISLATRRHIERAQKPNLAAPLAPQPKMSTNVAHSCVAASHQNNDELAQHIDLHQYRQQNNALLTLKVEKNVQRFATALQRSQQCSHVSGVFSYSTTVENLENNRQSIQNNDIVEVSTRNLYEINVWRVWLEDFYKKNALFYFFWWLPKIEKKE